MAYLDTIQTQKSALIRDEIRAGEQRKRLEQAVRMAILHGGMDISSVSDASGLTPAMIRAILDSPPEMDDTELPSLAGVV